MWIGWAVARLGTKRPGQRDVDRGSSAHVRSDDEVPGPGRSPWHRHSPWHRRGRHDPWQRRRPWGHLHEELGYEYWDERCGWARVTCRIQRSRKTSSGSDLKSPCSCGRRRPCGCDRGRTCGRRRPCGGRRRPCDHRRPRDGIAAAHGWLELHATRSGLERFPAMDKLHERPSHALPPFQAVVRGRRPGLRDGRSRGPPDARDERRLVAACGRPLLRGRADPAVGDVVRAADGAGGSRLDIRGPQWRGAASEDACETPGAHPPVSWGARGGGG